MGQSAYTGANTSGAVSDPSTMFMNTLNTTLNTMGGSGSGVKSPYADLASPFQAAFTAGDDAMAATRAAMNYQPMNVTAGSYDAGSYNAAMVDPSQFGMGFQSVAAPTMSAAQTSQADIDRFFNPYTDQVVDTSLADIDRARQMQANQAAAQAQAAGAFGGSRGALMEAEIGRNALDQSARTAGDLRRQGFTQAAQLAQQDVGRRQQANQLNAQQMLQAALANQRAGLTAGQANMRAQLSAALANQGAADAASQFNIGAADAANQFNLGQDLAAQQANQQMGLMAAQNALSGASQLAGLGQDAYDLGVSEESGIYDDAAARQAMMQAILGGGETQFNNMALSGQQALGFLAQALGASQIPQSQTTTNNPGLFQLLSLFASDIRLKKNIRRVGKTPGGHNLYAWDWKKKAKSIAGKTGPDMGVIAQDVMETRPDLVVMFPDGFYRVNYEGIA